MSQNEYEIKLQKLRLLEEKIKIREGLPHRHAFKRYKWQHDYQANRMNKRRLICAANQIGKSSIQICDLIEVATRPDLWPLLWPARFSVNANTTPYSWYLYPNQDTVMTEFIEKWEKDFLPRGEFRTHPVYGWKAHIVNKVLKKIVFNSGFTVYFKTYNQNVMDLQSGTVYAVQCDEELPIALLPELEARLYATDGYFSMAFTATIGQEFWRKVVEGTGQEEEWKDAWKIQVSMYDCITYIDGSKSVWTNGRIKRIEDNCSSNTVRLRRVWGKFIKDTGLVYSGFDRERNYRPYPKTSHGNYFKGLPKGWLAYSAVDYGSGGENNHPSAYSFLALDPSLTKIRWFRGRRMDKIETTAGDLFSDYKEKRGGLDMTMQSYDFAGNDFGLIATRAGESWEKAKKDHKLGEAAVNTALKTGMLVVYYDPDDEEPESIKLVHEMESLSEGFDKRKERDDLIDTVRYALMSMPIDWEAIYGEGTSKAKKKGPKKGSAEEVRPWIDRGEEDDGGLSRLEDEIDEWNELY